MNKPTFKTSEVAQLYEDTLPWCHAEFPFLDPKYSPGSNMPAIDFTPYITTWLETGNNAAIIELWTYLTSNHADSIYAIQSALTASLPSWIGISETAKHELHAIYILILRSAWGGRAINMSLLASSIASTTLACRQLSLPPDYARGNETLAEMRKTGKTVVLARAYSQELLDVICSEMGNFPNAAECDHDDGARLSLEKALSSLGTAEAAAERLKAIPPMARRVVYDRFTRGWGGGALRFGLYYEDRAYGCGDEANQRYIDWLDFFGAPSDQAPVPAALTKDKLIETLVERGVHVKKSNPRSTLLEQARAIPGLISLLISRYCPEQRDASPEWQESIQEWVLRVRQTGPVAAALVNFLATSTINGTKWPIAFKE